MSSLLPPGDLTFHSTQSILREDNTFELIAKTQILCKSTADVCIYKSILQQLLSSCDANSVPSMYLATFDSIHANSNTTAVLGRWHFMEL